MRRLSHARRSVLSQRDRRLQTRCADCRQIARQRRHDRSQSPPSRASLDSMASARTASWSPCGPRHRQHDAHEQPAAEQERRLAHDHADHIGAPGAERHPDADLAPAARAHADITLYSPRVAMSAASAPEKARQRCHQPLPQQRIPHLRFHRLKLQHDRPVRFRDGRGHLRRNRCEWNGGAKRDLKERARSPPARLRKSRSDRTVRVDPNISCPLTTPTIVNGGAGTPGPSSIWNV